MSIAPIETRYKGYRFRSRLEARWAVAFDTMGWKWRYEAEGYDIDGTRYLPDFFVDSLNTIVEIKPLIAQPSRTYIDQIDKLADHLKADWTVACGLPCDARYFGTRLPMNPAACAAAQEARFEFGESGAPMPGRTVPHIVSSPRAATPIGVPLEEARAGIRDGMRLHFREAAEWQQKKTRTIVATPTYPDRAKPLSEVEAALAAAFARILGGEKET